MGAGAVAASGDKAGYAHLLDPNRKWYNNKRCVFFFYFLLTIEAERFDLTSHSIIALNAWIVLL